jgi:hypothetical protein
MVYFNCMETKINFKPTKRIQVGVNPPQTDSMAQKLASMKVSTAIVARAKATIEKCKITRKRAPLA